MFNFPVHCLAIQQDLNTEYSDLYSDGYDISPVYNEVNYSQNSYSAVPENYYLTDEDIYLMAQIVYAESRSEPFEGKVAVASVILNRLNSSEFPKTIKEVVTQRYAFSCVKNGKITCIPDESSYLAVQKALSGYDPTSKAVFFYNPKISTSNWMDRVKKINIKTIGQHVFFRSK